MIILDFLQVVGKVSLHIKFPTVRESVTDVKKTVGLYVSQRIKYI